MQELSSCYISALVLTRLLKQENSNKKLIFSIGLSLSISGPACLSGSPLDMVFHIQAEDIVTDHGAGYTCNASSPQSHLQLMVIAFLTDLGICSYD